MSPADAPRDPAGEPAVPRFIVQSWIPVGQLVRRRAYTWLDDIDEASLGPVGFGAEVREARIARRSLPSPVHQGCIGFLIN